MAREEVMISLGVDNSALHGGFIAATDIAKSFTKKMSHAVNDSFKEGFKNFGALFGVTGIVEMSRRLGDMADEVKGASEAFGVSTDFIQGWRTAVSQNSGTVQDANKAIQKLSLNIGQGSESFAKWGINLTKANGQAKTTQEIILEIADKMRNTASASDRAAIAFDLFGKSGASLIPTLMQGGASLQSYIDSATKLSPQEIQEIADAQSQLHLALDKVTIALGKGVGWIVRLSEAFGVLSVKMSKPIELLKNFISHFKEAHGSVIGGIAGMLGEASVEADAQNPKSKESAAAGANQKQEERAKKAKEDVKKVIEAAAKVDKENSQSNETAQETYNRLLRERAEQIKILEDKSKTDLERANALFEIRKKEKDMLHSQKEIEREKTDEMKRQNELTEKRIGDIHDSFFAARKAVKDDQQHSTVDELAGTFGRGSQYQDEAQRILQLQKFEKYNRSGFFDSNTLLADKQQQERLKLTKMLEDKGVIAKDPVVDAIEKLNDQVTNGVSVKELQGDD